MRPLADQASIASDDSDSESEMDDVAPDGVRRLEAAATAWTKTSLIIAYVGLILMAFTASLESQTTTLLTPAATSSFKAHSLLGTIAVVSGVVYAVVKPIMAKFADVFGRLEAFSFCVFIYVVGYIMLAGSNAVETYAAAVIFYGAGATGLQLLQQIFIADTSDLLNRAIMSTIPDIPFLVTVWCGPNISADFINIWGWRWGYGVWAILLPVSFVPLFLSLIANYRKAAERGLMPTSPYAGLRPRAIMNQVWFELDAGGLLLLTSGIALILLPLTLAASYAGGWTNGSILGMMVVGAVCLAIFPAWENSAEFAPRAFFPPALFRHKTVVAGITIAFFYFMAFYLSVFPYFYSYLVVVSGQSDVTAGRITLTFTFASTVTSVIVSFVIKYTKHYKYFVTAGSCVYLMGLGLMLRFRYEGASTATLVACQMVTGIGGGMLNVPAQLGVQASARHADVASATAIFLTILEIGGAVGAAVSGAVWTNNLLPKLRAYLPPESQANATQIVGDYLLAANSWPRDSPTHTAISRAYQETMTKLLTIAVCVCIPLVPLSLVMKNYRLDQIDQKVKGTVIGGTIEGGTSREHEYLTGRIVSDSGGEYGTAGPSSAVFDKSRRKSN